MENSNPDSQITNKNNRFTHLVNTFTQMLIIIRVKLRSICMKPQSGNP
jgi:hypothetical protein